MTPARFTGLDQADVEAGLRLHNPRAWLDSLPPPKPGTHESDLRGVDWPEVENPVTGEVYDPDWRLARDWSRANREAS